jgi:hypothetical protein
MSGVPYDGGGLDQIQITVVTSWPPAHHVIHIHQAFHGQCRSQPVADHPTKKPRDPRVVLYPLRDHPSCNSDDIPIKLTATGTLLGNGYQNYHHRG